MKINIPTVIPILVNAKTPASNNYGVYAKSDGKIYKKSETGVESPFIRTTQQVAFSLPEDAQNTSVYFFAGQKEYTTSTIRSGSAQGFQNQGSCNPILLTTHKLVSASLAVRALGVQAAAPIYPVILKTELWSVGFGNEGTKLTDIDFSIPSNIPVGAWSPTTSNLMLLKSDINLLLNNTPHMFALKFINGTTASQVGQIRNCLVTLNFEL